MDLLARLRALLARPRPPMDRYYAWRDSRPDGLYDQAHREPAARINGIYTVVDKLPAPVSRPEEEPQPTRIPRSSSLHYHHSDPHVACFERHTVRGEPGWLRWPKDTPDGQL
jgi:hypothetical protein